MAVPKPEVSEKAVRQKFTVAYKLRILKESETFTEPGQFSVLVPGTDRRPMRLLDICNQL
jgi:hypothetical protein